VFELLFSERSPWSIRLGVENKFDASSQPGVDELDTTYFLNLGYSFE